MLSLEVSGMLKRVLFKLYDMHYYRKFYIFSFLMKEVDEILRNNSGYVCCSSSNVPYLEGFRFWNSKVI